MTVSQKMIRLTLGKLLPCFVAALLTLGLEAAYPQTTHLEIELDARDVHRRLLHSTITLMAGGDSVALLYPKWIPGCHGPTGPINNLAGFIVTNDVGKRISWERDYADPFRFELKAVSGDYPAKVFLTYICNPETFDCSATSTLAVINWNAISLYPEGARCRDLNVTPRMILPAGWKYATAMPTLEVRGDTVFFEAVTYEELLDYPVICGPYLKTLRLQSTETTEYFVHTVVDDEVLLPLVDSCFSAPGWNRLILETEALFGRTHFDAYHFLVAISDSIPHYGLEHRNSSVNSGGTTSLTEYGESDYFLQWVLPHEYVHAWCGKYRRPTGMNTPDYQEPKNMQLLWVYEGLTTYLGMVLYARSGLATPEYFKEDIAEYWGELRHKTGRDWRSLSDIAVSTYTVWGGSDSWLFLRRAADYYPEGAMLWLEADVRIRQATGGASSLDDFCRSFFGAGDIAAHSIPYNQDNLVRALTEVADYNWDSLITARIYRVSEALDETPLASAGYAFGYCNTKPKVVENEESAKKCRYYYESLGFAIANEDHKVLQIVPDSPADLASVSTGMSILGINGKAFSFERLDKAITDTSKNGEVVLLTQHGEVLQEHKIEYRGGLRWTSLQPIDGHRKWLDEITTPTVGH